MRHSIEDNKFSVRPSRGYLEIAERMQTEGLPDLNPENLEKFWKTTKTRKPKTSHKTTSLENRGRTRAKRKRGRPQTTT